MTKPPKLKIGPKKLREWAQEVERAILARQPLPGFGVVITADPNAKGMAYNATQK